MNLITVFTDGGARGNPGPAAIGVVIRQGEREQLFGSYIGETTNNIAEYRAVLEALKSLPEFIDDTAEKVDFYLDSQLVERQLNGQYRVKEPALQLLCEQVKERIRLLGVPCRFTHIPRAKNAQADRLVNQALDSFLALKHV